MDRDEPIQQWENPGGATSGKILEELRKMNENLENQILLLRGSVTALKLG